MLISKYLSMYDLDQYLERVIPVYKHRCDLMLNTMRATFPEEAKFSEPDGGLFTWVELPKSINTKDLSMKGVEKGVPVCSGLWLLSHQ